MKKTLSVILSLIFALSALSALTVTTAAAGATVKLNGKTVKFSKTSPYVQGSSVMLPAESDFLEAMGCSLERFGSEYVVTRGAKQVRAVKDSKKITVNGNQVALTDAARLNNGVICIPASEFLTGLSLWFSISGTTVTISSGTDEAYVSGLISGTPVGRADVWKLYAEAQTAKSEKRYADAIKAYEKILPNLYGDGDIKNTALVYGRLGECYTGVAKYARAAEAFRLCGKYWDICGGGEQSAQAARTKAQRLTGEISLYLKTDETSLSPAKTHGVSFEPKTGIVLGFTNDDQNTYESASAKAPGMWLKYFTYGDDLLSANNKYVIEAAKKYVVELAVEPKKGLSEIDDAKTKKLAQAIVSSGGSFIVRFAGEMNDSTSLWYDTPENYKAAFVKFAKVFRKYAPKVPIMWSPNFSPTDGVSDYYPGDEWVDYVGVSSYYFAKYLNSQEIGWGYDLFGTGITTARWSQQLDFLYRIYGAKKPFIISEGAASYIDTKKNVDITDFAADAIRDFYTYLPMRYPNLKFAVYFNVDKKDKTSKYRLTDKKSLIGAYNAAIADDSYLSSWKSSSPTAYVSFDELGPTKTIPAKTEELTAYVKLPDGSAPASVLYEINGTRLGTVTKAPYTIRCGFAKYENKLVTIKVTAQDKSGKALSSSSFRVKVGEVPNVGGFIDVKNSDFFAEAVLWAVGKKITSGTDSKHFSPNKGCTRAEVVTFLWRAAGSPAPSSSKNPFTDVKSDAYYYRAVKWAVSNGITSGTSKTEFSPNSVCTREQIVTFLWRAAGNPNPATTKNPFSDVKTSDYCYKAVLWAVGKKITEGTSAKEFSPKKVCTRGQVVTFLYRAKK